MQAFSKITGTLGRPIAAISEIMPPQLYAERAVGGPILLYYIAPFHYQTIVPTGRTERELFERIQGAAAAVPISAVLAHGMFGDGAAAGGSAEVGDAAEMSGRIAGAAPTARPGAS